MRFTQKEPVKYMYNAIHVPKIRMRKKAYLSDFERGKVVGARWACLSISKIAYLLGFSRTTISRVNWKISS